LKKLKKKIARKKKFRTSNMASLGDPGDPPPLPDVINRSLSLEEAIQAANIAGLNPDAKGLCDVIRVTPQNEKMFDEFIKTQ
jgi:hypothetical protein